MIEIFAIVLFTVNAVLGFSGYGLNRTSAGLGWVVAILWVIAYMFKGV